MSKMIAFCGLCCTECPTYLATKNNDNDARKKTAEMYSEKFGFDMKPEDINCDGCLSEGGMLISYCQTCDIRKCGRDIYNDEVNSIIYRVFLSPVLTF